MDETPSADRTGDGDDLDPRLHYANERTFLAWIRTSLALMTAGLVITQLLPASSSPAVGASSACR